MLGDLLRVGTLSKCFPDTINASCPADQHYITQENPAYARTGSLGAAREVESGESELEDYTYVRVHRH